MKNILLAVATTFVGLSAGAASAATFNYVSTERRSECIGVSFSDCTLNGASTVARHFFDDGAENGSSVNDSVFASLDGSETDVTLTTNGSGSWNYTPTGADPIITAFTVKVSGGYSIFEWDATSGTDFSSILFDTSTLGLTVNQEEKSLKKIMFFGVTPDAAAAMQINAVPIPATGLLLVAGLGGLAGLRRRRKS